MTRSDIKMANNDLIILNNDLQWAISDEQHIQDTINAFPGWWKENFSDGVGIIDFLNSSGKQQILARYIKIQLEADLYSVNNPEIVFAADRSLTVNPNAS